MADNFVVKLHDVRKAHLYTFGILTPTSPSSGEMPCLPHER